jgi:iron(III) transport system ATP-binding protein
MRPQVMLLDEPLSNLDAKLREEMRFEIKDLQVTTGVTIIYVTHDQAEAMAMSDRIVVMNQGKIHQIDTSEDIYRHPSDQFVADFVGLINLIPCRADSQRNGVFIPVNDHEIFHTTLLPTDLHTSAVLAVRPENITIEKVATSDSTTLCGDIERATYMGNMTDYLVKAGSHNIRVQMSGFSDFQVGNRVRLDIKTSSVFSG